MDSIKIVVGMGTCGIAAGADVVFQALQDEVIKLGLTNVVVAKTGCVGICKLEPIIEVIKPGEEKTTYIKMSDYKARRVVESHILEDTPIKEYMIHVAKGRILERTSYKTSDDGRIQSLNHLDFFKKQFRIALRNCGIIDPENIDDYIAAGGYKALITVINIVSPKDVIDIIKKSGLRGRGGGGFSTGDKWEFAAVQDSNEKYIICNADEGDPGAFMDRSVLEGDPHSIIEAMIIGGYAIGADKGFIYVRAEYPLAVERLEIALKQARKYKLLGEDILCSGFKFDIEIRLGAGAFVCGEETALMQSIEGKRGMPMPKPPFPSVKGLFQKPTVINNVETLANIPLIILKGYEWFRNIGTKKSPGTKVFALGGKITNTGLVEIPMGTTLREVIYDIGGGIPNGKGFKAVQTGGPSGGCIPGEYINTPLEYEALTELGSMMGSGGMIVMDEDNCMVDVARFFLDFTKDESCGKCVPCRIGTKRLLEILEKITAGNGTLEDINKLEMLGEQIKNLSLCGLGQTAPNPIISTLKYFKDEYISHVKDKKCPAKVCRNLFEYVVNEDKCRGCSLCTRNCPTGAITGKVTQKHKIDPEKCVKCGLCMHLCKFKAIEKI